MNYRSLAAAAAAVLLSLTAGCPAEETTSDTGGGTPSTVTPAIAAVDSHVTADGVDSTTISVTAGAAPLTLTTNRGAFASGLKYVVVEAVPDTVTLQSCSARTSISCAGAATIQAVGKDGGVAQTTVTFDAVETCSNKIDDNADSLVDCADPGCSGLSCGPGTAICVGTTCNCPGAASETSCTNGIDDDCNGKTDCEEPSCNALACSTSLASYRCSALECVDPATLYGISVTPERPRIPAQAGASTAVEVVVTYAGAPLAGATVAVTLSPATGLGALSTGSVTTDPQGRATVTFTGSGASTGVQTITATYTPAGGLAVSGSGTVALPVIGEIRVLQPNGILYPVMGVKYSGYRELNSLVVEVVDGSGDPYPDGLDVTFEHRALGGSTLADALAAPVCASSPCVQSASQTNVSGMAQAQLYSGTVAGVVRVSAKATAGGVSRSFDLPSIAIVGAKANAGHLAIVCEAKDGTEITQALAETTCHVSKVEDQLTCAALLKDRFGNTLGTSSVVSFMSEAGAVGPPALTPEYDPEGDPTSQAQLGSAVDFINTLGGKLPKDVAPLATEDSFSTGAPDACGVTTHNPRDGVVTVVAWTAGEEAFTDTNGNGAYDAGEPFVDLPEPFVDYDDDDARDSDEPFIDTDGDGAWDGANGVWDANSNIWTKTAVLYVGRAAFARSGTNDYLSRWMEELDAYLYPGQTPVAHFGVSPAFPAETFTDTNANGAWDAGEAFVDRNGNGAYDAAAVATTETLYATASDVNLNRLPQSATYTVSKPDGATFQVKLDSFSWDADPMGLSFGYQPCNGQTPTTCALDCAEVAAAAGYTFPGQCVMRTRVSSFSYGKVFAAKFTGGAAGTKDGPTEAYWNITSFNETLRITVTGTHE